MGDIVRMNCANRVFKACNKDFKEWANAGSILIEIRGGLPSILAAPKDCPAICVIDIDHISDCEPENPTREWYLEQIEKI